MSRSPRVLTLLVLAVALTLSAALLPATRSAAAASPGAPPAPMDLEAQEYAPDRLLVRFAPSLPEVSRASARAAVRGRVLSRYSIVPDLELLQLPPGLVVADMAGKVKGLPGVLYAQPDYVYRADVTPNDSRYGEQWAMDNIRASQAWDVSTGSASVVVAIIDTGIDYTHPDLAPNMWKNSGEIAGDGIDNDRNGYVDDVYGWDFAYNDSDPSDVYGHGTHTAGTVGAVGNNGLGVTGVNWNVKLMALKFMNDSGIGYSSDAAKAIQYAVDKGVKVSNNSWGGGPFDPSLYDAINIAKSAGHLFVSAAGNSGADNDTKPFYPASYNLDNVISVAAIDGLDGKASFSNYGRTTVDLGAPGVGILSTTPNRTYSIYNGTSMATPHVAGTIALLYGAHPEWTYAQVRDALFDSVRKVASMTNRTVTGGVLDAGAAVASSAEPPPPVPLPSSMHLSALTGSSQTINNNSWRATATIVAHDNDDNPLSGVVVTGNWTGASASSCTTGTGGQCTISKSLTKRTGTSTTFVVTSFTKSGYTYDPSVNESPVSVTVSKP